MSPRTVRAARLISHGRPVEVQSVELPEPTDAEVLVELAYGSLNPVDRYTVEGKVAADGPLPRTIGEEASGHVGGRAVVVAGGGLGSRRDGVFAQAAIVPRETVYELPDGVGLREAAAVSIVGRTAWSVVQIGEVAAGDRVLVLGASGGVGQPTVSYARSIGAEVWGQTASAAKADAIRAMGAAHAVVAADADTLADAVREFEPTVVIDPLGGAFTAAALSVLASHGRLVLFGTSSGSEATLQLQPLYRKQQRILTYAGLIATQDERRHSITQVLNEVAAGRMRLTIGAELPLADVNEAFRRLSARDVVGKVVLDLR